MGTVKYSGPVASFHCPTNAEIRSLKVHFSPKQLGEGDPSPENVREIVGWDGVEVEQRGKNLLGNLEDGYFQTFIPNGTQLIASTDIPTSGNNQVRYYRADKTEIDYWTLTESYMDGRKKRTFSTIEDAYYWRYTYMTLNVQLEYGSTATSYESYRGNTIDYEFGVLGKNKLDVSTYIDNEYVKSDGTFATNNSFQRTDYLHLPPGNYIYSSVKNDSVAAYSRVCGYTKDKTFVSMLNEQSKNSENYAMTFTVPDNVYYIVLQSYKNTSQEQIELGSTATAYEPYDPNHTVYGGWVDLISGEVCEEYNYIDLGDKNWTYGSADNNFYTVSPSDAFDVVRFNDNSCPFICTSYISSGAFVGDKIITMNNRQTGTSAVIRIRDTSYDDASVFKSSLDGVLLYYKMNIPITYHLAPTQLQTFLGHNNVWSNADYVEVEYDLHETQTILTRKQFIVANQPHIVKPAAASLQNFVTDMTAPLKECKVYFNPVQEGTGDPSPDNVRPITGWTGMDVYRTGKNLFNANDWWQDDGGITIVNENKITCGTVSYVENKNRYTLPSQNTYVLSFHAKTLSNTSGLAYVNIGAYTKEGSRVDNSTIILGDAGNEQDMSLSIPDTAYYLQFNNWAYNGTVELSNIQLEVGSTATAYEPYSSTTIPITFPSVFNILSSTTITTNKTLSAAGEETNETGMSVTNYIKVNEGDTYKLTFTSKEGARTRRIWSYNASKEPIEYLASASWVTVDTVGSLQATIPSGVEYIRVCYKTADEDIFLEGPESSVIYGGYVDLVKGEIVEEWHKIVADGVNVTCTPNYRYQSGDWFGGAIVYLNPYGLYDLNSNTTLLCDTLPKNIPYSTNPYLGTTFAGYQYVIFYLFNINDYNGVLPEKSEVVSMTNAWLQEHPTTIVYKLLEPIHHPLTPTQLKTLRGTNNIWSNSNGDITVQFWKH